MSQKDYTAEKRKNKHLNELERYKIEILLKEKMTPFEIAKRLGRHQRTVEREIQRGSVILLDTYLELQKEYCADSGQRIYKRNARNKGPGLKIGIWKPLKKHNSVKMKACLKIKRLSLEELKE